MRSPKPFLAILEYCKEAGEGLGTRLCLLLTQPVAKTTICHFLRLLQSFQFLVSNLFFAHGVFGHCITLDSQPDIDLDQQRHNAGSSAKIFVLHGWLSHESKGGVQQNWRRQELSVQDVCVLWSTRVVVSCPCRKPGTMQDTCTLRHCEYEKLGKKLCVVGEPGCRPGAKVRTYTKCQSSQAPELVLFPNPFTCVRKRVLSSEQLFLSHGAG